MNERTSRWLGNAIGIAMLAAFVWLVWGWWSFSGLYALLARVQLSVFGSFGAISTFAIGVVVIGGLASLAFGPVIRFQRQAGLIKPRSPAVAKAMTERAMKKFALGGGMLALIVTLAAGALLYRDTQRDAVSAQLDLSHPQPLPPGAGRIRLIGFTKPELSIDVETRQTPGVSVSSASYMAVVGSGWHAGMPVPVVVQGSPGIGLPSVGRFTAEAPETLAYDLPAGYLRSFSSGFAAHLLGQRGAIVDSHTLFLDTQADSERSLLLTVVVLGGLLAALGIAGGLVLVRSAATARAPVQLQIREVNHGASGGSYACIFEASVVLSPRPGIAVTVKAVEPANTAPGLVEEARKAIRDGAQDALQPLSLGAAIEVTRLVIHEIDFKPAKFRMYTARDLRRLAAAAPAASPSA